MRKLTMKFMINFVLSAVGWVIATFGMVVALNSMIFRSYGDVLLREMRWLMMVIVLLGFAIIFVAIPILLFFVGCKLNLLDKKWLNYLSVCGSFATSAVGVFLMFIQNDSRFQFIATTFVIIAAISSIIMWLGMLYKSRKTVS